MPIPRPLLFIGKFVTIGLAAAFVILYLYPALQHNTASKLDLKETSRQVTTSDNGPVSYADAVDEAAPAVVNVYTKKVITERNPMLEDPFFRKFFGEGNTTQRQRTETSLGSGVLISKQGFVVTNNHVIDMADEIEVALHDGRTTSAHLIGADPDTDLAVLKIDLEGLPAITLGKSEQLRVGDVVLAIGNPFGVGQTVTSGIVSATDRSMLGLSVFENFIQTDAAINPGNSGGALVNAYGELIGINTAIFSKSGGSQGIGFAIPVSLVKDVMTQIIQYGKVVRGWLGIAIQDITPELAEGFDLKSAHGVVVTNIVREGPADKAGLDRGDILTHINGNLIANVNEALLQISRLRPGAEIKLKGLRNGKAFSRDATIGQRPNQQESP